MTLVALAETIMYMYYRDYPSDEEFFDIDSFKSAVVQAYSKLLLDDYKEQKLINRQTEGISMVSLSADLLTSADLDIQKEDATGLMFVKLPKRYLVFPFDPMATAIQSVAPVGKRCNEFIKVSIDDRWKICQIPSGAASYYSAEIDKIVFERLSCKDLNKVRVTYAQQISSDDDDFDIADTRAFQIQTMVLQVFFAAKDNNTIDMSNDSNNNTTPSNRNRFQSY
jgi:hypothetical protein